MISLYLLPSLWSKVNLALYKHACRRLLTSSTGFWPSCFADDVDFFWAGGHPGGGENPAEPVDLVFVYAGLV